MSYEIYDIRHIDANKDQILDHAAFLQQSLLWMLFTTIWFFSMPGTWNYVTR